LTPIHKGTILSKAYIRHFACIPKDPAMPRLGIHLTAPQVKRLKEISCQTGLAVSDLIRRALDDWLEKFEEKERNRNTGDSTHEVVSIFEAKPYQMKSG